MGFYGSVNYRSCDKLIFKDVVRLFKAFLHISVFNPHLFHNIERNFMNLRCTGLHGFYGIEDSGENFIVYFDGVQGQSLWTLPSSLHYVLGNMGVPHDLLRAPLPPEGPRALLKYVRIPS